MLKQNIVKIEVDNDVDQPVCQHSIKKRSASLNALERMQISKKIHKWHLAMDSTEEESLGDSESDS